MLETDHHELTQPADILGQQRFVLAGSWPAEHADEIAENGWTVVNAPRPLHGCITWEGDFLSGVFYAAGPWDEYAKRWRTDDATLLSPLTPAEIVEKARAYCTEYGYVLEEIAAEFEGAAEEVAAQFGLPWEDAWLAAPAAS